MRVSERNINDGCLESLPYYKNLSKEGRSCLWDISSTKSKDNCAKVLGEIWKRTFNGEISLRDFDFIKAYAHKHAVGLPVK